MNKEQENILNNLQNTKEIESDFTTNLSSNISAANPSIFLPYIATFVESVKNILSNSKYFFKLSLAVFLSYIFFGIGAFVFSSFPASESLKTFVSFMVSFIYTAFVLFAFFFSSYKMVRGDMDLRFGNFLKNNYLKCLLLFTVVAITNFLLGLALVIPGIIFSLCIAPFIFISAIDEKSSLVELIKKSFELVKGFIFKIFLLNTMSAFFLLIINLIVSSAVVYLLSFISKLNYMTFINPKTFVLSIYSGQASSIFVVLLFSVIFILINTFIYSTFASINIKIYYFIKKIKYGLVK